MTGRSRPPRPTLTVLSAVCRQSVDLPPLAQVLGRLYCRRDRQCSNRVRRDLVKSDIDDYGQLVDVTSGELRGGHVRSVS